MPRVSADVRSRSSEPGESLTYVWSKNYHRRHLTPGQGAVALARRDEVMSYLREKAEASAEEGNRKGAQVVNTQKNGSSERSVPLAVQSARVNVEAARIAGVSPTTMQAAITFANAERKALPPGDD